MKKRMFYVTVYNDETTCGRVVKYTGKDLNGVLIRILKRHLGFEADDFESPEDSLISDKVLLAMLNDRNADGYEYIISIIEHKGKLIYKWM